MISRKATLLSKCIVTFHLNVLALFQHCSNFTSLLTSWFFFYMPFTKHDICAIKTLEKYGSYLTLITCHCLKILTCEIHGSVIEIAWLMWFKNRKIIKSNSTNIYWPQKSKRFVKTWQFKQTQPTKCFSAVETGLKTKKNLLPQK